MSFLQMFRGNCPLTTISKLVFSKTKARLGGRVRYIITGSAPLSSEVMAFLRCAFCCDVFEGYGQTETSAGAFIVGGSRWEECIFFLQPFIHEHYHLRPCSAIQAWEMWVRRFPAANASLSMFPR